jgi:hypothetical protein
MSDNGTNFSGSSKELQQFFKDNNTSVNHFFVNKNIRWQFMPSYSPHFGGIHESNIGVVKRHIKKAIGSQVLTYESFMNLLCKIECIVNSRPMFPLSDSPNDLNPLTPSHFLITNSLIHQEALHIPTTNKSTHYKLITNMVHSFWSRWSIEYLHTLQRRYKWKKTEPILPKIGQLVVLKEKNLPVHCWKLARVTQVHPGNDKLSRVVTLKTHSGLTTRAIRNIAILPVEE